MLLETRDGVASLPRGDLILGAGLRGPGGAHGVKVPAVRLALDEARSLTAAGPADSVTCARVDLHHVIAIGRDARHIVRRGVRGDIDSRMLHGDCVVCSVLVV